MHVNYNNPTLKFIAVHPSFFERKKKKKKSNNKKSREDKNNEFRLWTVSGWGRKR